MQKQKHGFLLFICSLIPGAGEMYMGLFKQGLSIMTLFLAIIAAASSFNTEFLVIFLPVIWFYSFFHVHNLKELPEEEFYATEDNYILHLDQVFRGFENVSSKHVKIAAIILIVFGCSVLWNGFRDMLYWILPGALGQFVQSVMYQIPSIIIGLLIIVAGYQILTGKVKAFQKSSEKQEQQYEPNKNPESINTDRISETPSSPDTEEHN